MKLGKFKQTSADNRLRVLDYSEWLATGETITAVTFDVQSPTTSPAFAVANETIINSGTQVQFFASGGVTLNTYIVTVTVTTSAGQTKEDYIYFFVQDPP